MKSSAFPLCHLHMYRTSPRRPRKPESGAGESFRSRGLGSCQLSLSCAAALCAGTSLFQSPGSGLRRRYLLLFLLSPGFHLLVLSFPYPTKKLGLVEHLAPVPRAAFPSLCKEVCRDLPPSDSSLALLGITSLAPSSRSSAASLCCSPIAFQKLLCLPAVLRRADRDIRLPSSVNQT